MNERRTGFGAWRGVLAASALGLAGPGAAAQNQVFATDFGGADRDGASSIEATSDGGYIASGFTYSFSPNSLVALYLVKTDAAGALEWSRTFELSDRETYGAAVREVPGGGYVVAGRAGWNGFFDSFLLRTDAEGNELWTKFYDAGDDDRAHALAIAPDGGFILGGQAWFGNELFGDYDMYIVKTDSRGLVEWTQTFEHNDDFGAGADIVWSIEPVGEGGYVIAGYTQSDVWAGWLLRIDALGNLMWDRIYDYSWASDVFSDVRPLADGGFILAGLFGNNQQSDVDLALVRTDSEGREVWTRTFGRVGHDEQGRGVGVLPDGGFVLAGSSSSWETSSDITIIRTTAVGDLVWRVDHGGDQQDRAEAVAIGRDAIVAAGTAWSFGNGLGDIHLLGLTDPSLSCVADFNGDGVVNTQDVLAFLNAWNLGDGSADINGDGLINTQDVLAFLNLWNTGC